MSKNIQMDNIGSWGHEYVRYLTAKLRIERGEIDSLTAAT
jgi:hypothetical protein